MQDNRIKCGKCQSEYHPRLKEHVAGATTGGTVQLSNEDYDYSCPVCKQQGVSEGKQPAKKMLLDQQFMD